MTSNGLLASALRWFDRGAAFLLMIGVLDFGAYALFRGHSPAGGPAATLVAASTLVLGCLVLLVPWRSRTGVLCRGIARAVVCVAILVGAKLEYDRLPHRVPDQRKVGLISEAALNRLSSELQLRWVLRIAAHAISTGNVADSVLVIPPTWPLPADFRLSVVRHGASVTLTAVDTLGTRACMFTLLRGVSLPEPLADRADPIVCDRASASTTGRAVSVIIRRQPLQAELERASIAARTSDEWTQYRRTADRDADELGRANSAAHSWRAVLDGEVRSTPSVAGDAVLIGTHGAGAIYAFDSESGRLRWMHYLPNWVHQDVVSDGDVAVVGFGDNHDDSAGRTPAGVSAFSLATGELLWSAFEGNSVMTSPVIWRGHAVYITAAGMLRVRDLHTGAETGHLWLPGRTPMAPPALVGDTLVASLDDDEYVCAIQLQTVKPIWCTPLNDVAMAGHSAPTVIDGRVYASAAVLKHDGPFGISSDHWYALRMTLGWIRERALRFAGQQVWALDLGTGRVVWKSPVFAAVNDPVGHISGTTIVAGDYAVTVLPIAGSVVALDKNTGQTRWVHESGPARGPAAYARGHLLLTLSRGELQAVDPRTGQTACSIHTDSRFDRAGPAVESSAVFFASVRGVLYSVPLAKLDGCDERAVRAFVN